MAPRLPRFTQHTQAVLDARKLNRILEADMDEPAVRHATAGGDRRRLRGTPVIARGVPGAIPGSSPVGALIARETRQQRRPCS